MKRYQVATYSSDIGADDKMDFDRMSDAIKEARRWLSIEEASFVYDQQKRIVRHAFRGSPELAFNARAITPACIMHV